MRELADQVTDVVVISHGWNNDMDEARRLYRNLFASMDAVRAAGLAGRPRRSASSGSCGPRSGSRMPS